VENMKLARMMELGAVAHPAPAPANPLLLDGLPFGVLHFQHSATQYNNSNNSTLQQRQGWQRGKCGTKGAGCGTDLMGGPIPGVEPGEETVDLHLLLLVLAFTLGLTAGVGGSMFVGVALRGCSAEFCSVDRCWDKV